MHPRKSLYRFLFVAGFLAALCGCDDTAPVVGTSSSGGGPPLDPSDFEGAPNSCVFNCPVGDCPEHSAPYECPAMGDWSKIGHYDTCEAWDGKYPEVSSGKCTVTDPAGEALKYPGPDPDDPTLRIMPGGRRQRPWGKSWAFREPDLYAGMTSNVISIPNSSLVVTVDSGYGDHVIRLVDAAKVGQGDPVVSLVKFAAPVALNWGIAFAAPDRVYVPTGDGKVFGFQMDLVAKTIAQSDALSVVLPPSTNSDGKSTGWYASSVAVSPDGKRLVVSPVWEKRLLAYDIEPGSASYGAQLGSVVLPQNETFGVYFDPLDASGERAYVSMWAGKKVVEVDLSDVTNPAIARSFTTGKDPQGIAFIDARWMVIADDFADALSVVDRMNGTVTAVPIDPGGETHGHEPSMLAYDQQSNRLYVTLAGVGAIVAFDVDTSKTPPTFVELGRLPTQWWPSGIALQADGTVVLSSLRGEGRGALDGPYSLDSGEDGEPYLNMHGGIQVFPAPSPVELSAGAMEVRANNRVSELPGYPSVNCPDGTMDFPVPATNTQGPSPVIDHIFVIVRENKAFDAVFGDMPGVKGKPELTLKASTADMDNIWQNLRSLAKTFTYSDNFYTAAEISSLGHVWTTYGRSNDYSERTWAMAAYGRFERPVDVQNGGVAVAGRPEEGSMFDWLGKNGVPYDVLGEVVGAPEVFVDGHPPNDFKFPGGLFVSLSYPDHEKACYVAARARVRCDFGQVVYMVLPNDHTLGLSPKTPDPETMCAVNDEATGMVVSAISKSPLWKRSLIMITQDDPAQGGDHVDAHRTVFVVASPWVRRGYVSKAHIDMSSFHKIIAHVHGLPYPNVQVEQAGLPLDMFTSTPDYTPYEYKPRIWPASCGIAVTKKEQRLTEQWDIDDVDRSPGLDVQVTRWMRGRQLGEPANEKQPDK